VVPVLTPTSSNFPRGLYPIDLKHTYTGDQFRICCYITCNRKNGNNLYKEKEYIVSGLFIQWQNEDKVIEIATDVKFGYASKEYVRQNNYPCVIFFDGTGV
jgi:hypothetical protein